MQGHTEVNWVPRNSKKESEQNLDMLSQTFCTEFSLEDKSLIAFCHNSQLRKVNR